MYFPSVRSIYRSLHCLFAVAWVASASFGATFGPGVEVSRFPAELNEISGMVESRHHQNVFWVHNDSGDAPQVYAVNTKGQLLGTYQLAGAEARDWEEMAIGPGPGGKSYLYLADIGDNSAKHESIAVYRVLEPEVSETQAAVNTEITGVTKFEFVYEDGPRDAESFFVDPLTDAFYVITKRDADRNRVYRVVAPKPDSRNTLELVATIPVTWSTAADISPDGLQILVRRYSGAEGSRFPASVAGYYWSRADASTSIVDMLRQEPEVVPLAVERQGEAICFDAEGAGFYTTSERGPGDNPPPAPLTFYSRIKNPVE